MMKGFLRKALPLLVAVLLIKSFFFLSVNLADLPFLNKATRAATEQFNNPLISKLLGGDRLELSEMDSQDFELIPGVSQVTARKLARGGYESYRDIKGIGVKKEVLILEYLKEP